MNVMGLQIETRGRSHAEQSESRLKWDSPG